MRSNALVGGVLLIVGGLLSLQVELYRGWYAIAIYVAVAAMVLGTAILLAASLSMRAFSLALGIALFMGGLALPFVYAAFDPIPWIRGAPRMDGLPPPPRPITVHQVVAWMGLAAALLGALLVLWTVVRRVRAPLPVDR